MNATPDPEQWTGTYCCPGCGAEKTVPGRVVGREFRPLKGEGPVCGPCQTAMSLFLTRSAWKRSEK